MVLFLHNLSKSSHEGPSASKLVVYVVVVALVRFMQEAHVSVELHFALSLN